MDILIQFAHFSYLSAFIPFFVDIVQWKKLDGRLKSIVLICFLGIVSDSISLFLITQRIRYNNWISSNIFLIIQAILLTYFLGESLRWKHYRWILVSLFVFSLVNLFLVQSPGVFNSYSNYLFALVLIAACLIFLYRLLKDLPTLDIYRYSSLWIVFAILTYYGGTLFLFLFNNYLLSLSIVSHKAIWILHNSLNILKNLLFALALWQQYRNVRLSR